jgi:hypothetical protein
MPVALPLGAVEAVARGCEADFPRLLFFRRFFVAAAGCWAIGFASCVVAAPDFFALLEIDAL